MTTVHKSIFINAPRKKVWETLISDATYREWTKPFNAGSYFKGSWEEGSKILFLGPRPDGKGEGGMVSRIAVNRPYEFISIEHLGIIDNGVEDTTSEKIKGWAGNHENYTLVEKDGGTELTVDCDIDEKEMPNMTEMFVKAFEKVKELSEA